MKTAATFTNRLAGEKSPYLLQHAQNPVDWWPWGEAAFEQARSTDRPIFLSIGYSTCHWCHVMAHESFENPDIADLLNRHFICIKVDREERPDVDRVYMTFVQATTGSGGWPMSVFLTPDLKPFVGGTYFPPKDRPGHPGFDTFLQRLAGAWKNQRADVIAQGDRMLDALREHPSKRSGASILPGRELLQNGYEQFAGIFDSELGGFGGAPKFPRPVTLNFLLRFGFSGCEPALDMALCTLRKMADGGLQDHLGGGFHRYSVDRFWHIPHFEKMLYDQAQLAVAYLDAYQLTRDPAFEKTARGILDYVLRDLADPAGGFYSAEDADSLDAHQEKSEGAFYIWTKQEIDSLLGDAESGLFNLFYGVEPEGNAPPGSDPQGEFAGRNTLIRRMTVSEAAQKLNKSEIDVELALLEGRRRLFEARARRPRPHLDDKIITAWNGLMISAFARAAQVLGDPLYLKAANDAAVFARTGLARDGGLVRCYRQGASEVGGFADDYAFLIQGLLDLYEASFNACDLRWAMELQAKQDALFADPEQGGYFNSGAADPHLLLRMKEEYDGAEPSPNSVAALNLLRLAEMTGNDSCRERAEKTMGAFSNSLERMPHAMPQMLCAFDFWLASKRRIVIAGSLENPDTQALLREVHRHFLPHKVLLLADPSAPGKAALIPMAVPVEGKAAAYVCEGTTCLLPVCTPETLEERLFSLNHNLYPNA